MDHKETGCQAHPEGPILCENNCGFFGSAATMNMCSKCHKDMMLKQEQAKLAASSIGSIVNGTSSSNGNEPVVAAASVNVQARPVEPKTISSQSLFSFGSGENGDTKSFSFGSGENGDTKSFSFGSGEIGDTKSFSFGSGANGEPFSFGLVGLVENADPKTFTFGSGENGEPKPEGPKRCVTCNKRVGLTGFNCRCGHLFCAVHRYSDKHDCPYDYRTAARDAIAKANPVVKAEKIEKI